MKKLLSVIVLGLVLAMPVKAQTPAEPVVTGWVHIIGCPSNKMELFVFFIGSDGKTHVAHFTEENYPGDEKMREVIGNVKGYTRQFDCGIST